MRLHKLNHKSNPADNSKVNTSSVQFKNNRSENSVQLKIKQMANPSIQRKENKTGMPDQLKSGVENLSGMDMSDVKVHYNSSQPAQLQAHAFAQGNQIHLGPGQERHLPHEAWHVVQQKQGRVSPTKQLKGKVNINDDHGLEKEADVMGAKALQGKFKSLSFYGRTTTNSIVQRVGMKTDADLDDRIDARGYYRWSPLRTGLVDDDEMGGHKKAEGFGHRLSGSLTTLTTLVKWGQPTQDTGFEGISMNAEKLGPDHKLGSPPASNGIWAVRRRDFSALSGKRYIAGHLLNDNLGGPGNNAENLTAIPSSANSEHSDKIEEPIKEKVNKNGEWMHYSVQVTYAERNNVLPAAMGYTEATAPLRRAAAIAQGRYQAGTHANTVRIRYANRLTAKWGPLASDGNPTGSTEGKTISINSPAHGVGTSDPAVNLQGDDPMADHHDADIGVVRANAAVTSDIGHQHLVLTNTGDIRAAHNARRPVVDHHQAYEDEATENIATLAEEKRLLEAQVAILRTDLRASQSAVHDWEELYYAMARRLVAAGIEP